ncbi:MAG: AAA family ATPase, partial [Clostridiaceae bacterium]|nr:AAA family ATPase [Clostridiaceae bacterium]
MYRNFYEFTKTPFSREIPTEELYPSSMLLETVSRLKYAASNQLFAVLTGDCGTGKTTAVRRLKNSLDDSKFTLLYLTDSQLTPRHFYNGLLSQLGQEGAFYRGDARRKLHTEIEVIKVIQKINLVVVIDEAHLLNREMLEEVRFLLNFKMDAMSPLSLILVAQSELWNRLELKSFTAIRQRVDLRCRLSNYDRAETGSFITRQLEYAGAIKPIFTEAAIDEIFSFSSGVPRLINKLCINCLIYGSTGKHRLIDDHMVRLV